MKKLEMWRNAFDAAIKDPAFLADADRQGYDIEPMTGLEVGKAIASIYATPQIAIAKAAQFMGGK
jgi:hypothetical protein